MSQRDSDLKNRVCTTTVNMVQYYCMSNLFYQVYFKDFVHEMFTIDNASPSPSCTRVDTGRGDGYGWRVLDGEGLSFHEVDGLREEVD